MKNKLLFLATTVLFLFLIGLYWLAIGGGIIGGLGLGLCYSKVSLARAIRRRNGLFATIVLTGVFVLAILIRVFLMEIYTVPSGSMEKSLIPGDRIMMSKVHYGPKMPQSPFEIPWVNLLVYMNKEARAAMDSTWWGFKRAKGFTEISANDVVVFDPPHDPDHHYIKRCVGLPGDTLSLENASVYINDRKQREPQSIQRSYAIWEGRAQSSDFLPENTEERIMNQSEYRQMKLSNQKQIALKDYPVILFSQAENDSLNWSTNEWGPIVIPKKGEQVKLT